MFPNSGRPDHPASGRSPKGEPPGIPAPCPSRRSPDRQPSEERHDNRAVVVLELVACWRIDASATGAASAAAIVSSSTPGAVATTENLWLMGRTPAGSRMARRPFAICGMSSASHVDESRRTGLEPPEWLERRCSWLAPRANLLWQKGFGTLSTAGSQNGYTGTSPRACVRGM